MKSIVHSFTVRLELFYLFIMSVNKINLTIDGLDVEVAEGSSVLQACEVLGLEIPDFVFTSVY